jgi:Rrp15p
MASSISKKRKIPDGMHSKPARLKKKFKQQLEYNSDFEEEQDLPAELAPVRRPGLKPGDDAEADDRNRGAAKGAKGGIDMKLATQEEEGREGLNEGTTDYSDEGADGHDPGSQGPSDSSDDGHEDDMASNASSKKPTNQRRSPKRHDPTAFATSISKILSTKLPTSARVDPVLSRSRTATQTTSDLTNEKLERQARAKLRAEKKEELDRDRIRDVLGIERGEAGQTAEEEKRLRKIAQRGVVKLFNAVRAAQVRGEEAAQEERRKGTIGVEERKKVVNEVSKQSFLELISGKQGRDLKIEEA